MAMMYGDRVKQQTSNTAGTVSLTLSSSVLIGFKPFSTRIGHGNTCYYTLEDRNGTAWEVGIGTLTVGPPDVLSRDTVLDSSDGNTKIALTSGVHTVFCTYPATAAFNSNPLIDVPAISSGSLTVNIRSASDSVFRVSLDQSIVTNGITLSNPPASLARVYIDFRQSGGPWDIPVDAWPDTVTFTTQYFVYQDSTPTAFRLITMDGGTSWLAENNYEIIDYQPLDDTLSELSTLSGSGILSLSAGNVSTVSSAAYLGSVSGTGLLQVTAGTLSTLSSTTYQSSATNLAAISTLTATAGFLAQTSGGEFTTRVLQPGTNITITYPAGDAGNPVINASGTGNSTPSNADVGSIVAVERGFNDFGVLEPFDISMFAFSENTLSTEVSSYSDSPTYYVDPNIGDDSNNGTSQLTPWKTIPGTRTTNNSDFLNIAWGEITTSNTIQAGDIIEIKAGTTMTSVIGGRLAIDSNYYQNGISNSPIIIRVSDTWGAGNFTYNATGITIPTYYPAVNIDRRDYVQIRGFNSTNRFSIINASGGGWGILANGSDPGDKQLGIVFDYLELANNSSGGSSITRSDNWTISNSISHDNFALGFDTGGVGDGNCNNGLYSDNEAYSNGLTQEPYEIAHGFGLFGCTNITYLRCVSHNNGRDGFDFGTVSNTNSASAVVINCSSYNNGEDGFGANGGTTGTQTFNYINCISFDNDSAGWAIYQGVQVGIYHSIAHSNGIQNYYGGNIITYNGSEYNPLTITLINNIFYKPKAHANIYFYTSSGSLTITSDYNIYMPRSSDSETGFEYPYGTELAYTAPPAFIGAHDKLGIAQDPVFSSAASSTVFSANDYHLTSGSTPAINAGKQLSLITSDPVLINAIANDKDGRIRASIPEIGPFEYI